MTKIKKILRAYLIGFLIVLLSFGSIVMSGCDTGSTGDSRDQLPFSGNGGEEIKPEIPPEEDNYWIVGEWVRSDATGSFSFLFHDDYTWERVDNYDFGNVLGSGTYTCNETLQGDLQLSLVDTLNGTSGTYNYYFETFEYNISVNLHLDPDWSAAFEDIIYGYWGGGNWPE